MQVLSNLAHLYGGVCGERCHSSKTFGMLITMPCQCRQPKQSIKVNNKHVSDMG